MAWRFSAERADCALDAREAFVDTLQGANRTVDGFTARLIFTELVANVVRHAPGPIEISLDAIDERLWLHVSDRGPPFEWRPLIPGRNAESGRGMFLISQCVADVAVERTRVGNTVHVKFNQSAVDALP